jgi:hypothetical protein
MGDLSYELAHPSKFSDWTDDGDDHALPPPSLGTALLSKARAAIKASREAVTSKHNDDPKISGLPSSSTGNRSRAPTLAPSSLSGFRSRRPTMVNPPLPKPESPIHRWLDLGASISPPASPTIGSRQSPSRRAESPRVTAFQFLENANQLSSPSRIRRQTDITNTAQSYSQMIQAQERSQAQARAQAQGSFINRYPDFEVAPNQAGPSSSRLPIVPLGRAFEVQDSPRTKARRTTTSSVLRTWDQAEVTPADRSLHYSGTQKSSSSRKGKESLFSSFKKKERSRSIKTRAEDVRFDTSGRPSSNQNQNQNQTSGRRSLPPVRGLRNMFSMEPIVQIDARPTPSPRRDGLPPDKPLPMVPNEFGMMVRAPTQETTTQSRTPAFVCLNSPPPQTSSLPGKLPVRQITSRRSSSSIH